MTSPGICTCRSKLLFQKPGLQALQGDCQRERCLLAGGHGSHQRTGFCRAGLQPFWILWYCDYHNTQDSKRPKIGDNFLQERYIHRALSFTVGSGEWSLDASRVKLHVQLCVTKTTKAGFIEVTCCYNDQKWSNYALAWPNLHHNVCTTHEVGLIHVKKKSANEQKI